MFAVKMLWKSLFSFELNFSVGSLPFKWVCAVFQLAYMMKLVILCFGKYYYYSWQMKKHQIESFKTHFSFIEDALDYCCVKQIKKIYFPERASNWKTRSCFLQSFVNKIIELLLCCRKSSFFKRKPIFYGTFKRFLNLRFNHLLLFFIYSMCIQVNTTPDKIISLFTQWSQIASYFFSILSTKFDMFFCNQQQQDQVKPFFLFFF